MYIIAMTCGVVGTVLISSNDRLNPMVPFGGAKQSGYGLEFCVEGLKAFGIPKVSRYITSRSSQLLSVYQRCKIQAHQFIK